MRGVQLQYQKDSWFAKERSCKSESATGQIVTVLTSPLTLDGLVIKQGVNNKPKTGFENVGDKDQIG